jgi:hypothetical protein
VRGVGESGVGERWAGGVLEPRPQPVTAAISMTRDKPFIASSQRGYICQIY